MSIEPSTTSLSGWFSTPLGARLLDAEQAYFDRELADVFGFNAIQLGLPEFDFLRANRMPFRCVIGPEGPVRAQSDHCALPLQAASADLVVLPHALEFSPNPHQVLREVSRVLVPEGHVVLSGFNPWSLWGLRRAAASRDGAFPWCGQFINLPRIKDWMALLGFELAAGRMCFYAPPVAAESWFRRFGFMEAAGDRWWPFAGGIYFLHGIKRVHGMRIITPMWRRADVRKKALAAVPQKSGGPEDALAARSGLVPDPKKPAGQ
jgi:SAM-dependent methyltransferase